MPRTELVNTNYINTDRIELSSNYNKYLRYITEYNKIVKIFILLYYLLIDG